ARERARRSRSHSWRRKKPALSRELRLAGVSSGTMGQPHDKVCSRLPRRVHYDRTSVCGNDLADDKQPQSAGVRCPASASSERVENAGEQFFRYDRALVVYLDHNTTLIALEGNFDAFSVAMLNRICKQVGHHLF